MSNFNYTKWINMEINTSITNVDISSSKIEIDTNIVTSNTSNSKIENDTNVTPNISNSNLIENDTNVVDYGGLNSKNGSRATAILAISATTQPPDSENSKNSRNSSSKRNENLNDELYGITIEELKSFAGEDWDDYKDNPEAIECLANLMISENLKKKGELPTHYTATTWCNSCGDYVYVPSELTNGGRVLGCPWCYNRANGLPVPKVTLENNQHE